MRRAWRGRVAPVALVVLTACLSPTLPLPPPAEPDTIQRDGEEWTLVGECVEGAEVVGYNEGTGRGSVYIDQSNAGIYSLTVEGEPCDVIVIRQVHGEEASGETRVILTVTEDGVAVDPSECP